VRLAVETWSPEYGAPLAEAEVVGAATEINADLERPLDQWGPVRPPPATTPFPVMAFVDGIRRVDARVWVGGAVGPGLCASWAAGVVRCGARAEIGAVVVERGLFSSSPEAAAVETEHGRYELCRVAGEQPDDLVPAVQRRMRELEAEVAGEATADLVVVDGPLANRRDRPAAIGFIKTHHATYGPEKVQETVARLDDGERTPVFVTRGSRDRGSRDRGSRDRGSRDRGSRDRHSWYVRLPGPRAHPWSGIVRCEASDGLDRDAVVALADRATLSLPRFASTAHREPRAPQNLTPIAGLEQHLRRRLGDRELLERSLRRAAA
jgi:hypothetical protein